MILGSFVFLESKIKKVLEIHSRILARENSELSNQLQFPNITLDNGSNAVLLAQFSTHASQSQWNLADYLTKDEFFNQLQSSYGKKGRKFNQFFKSLKEIADYNSEELKKLSKSFDDFFKALDQCKVSNAEKIKVALNKYKASLNKELEDFKQKVKILALINANFEEIMKLAQKASQ